VFHANGWQAGYHLLLRMHLYMLCAIRRANSHLMHRAMQYSDSMRFWSCTGPRSMLLMHQDLLAPPCQCGLKRIASWTHAQPHSTYPLHVWVQHEA